ncbi:MAG: hypothetical protein KKB90_00225 [Actinobacteria bacterium]|nr:hypothetical protein [Actinomycetota bacterium]MCG2819662.1 hypothetical protein [Actinomycetes bacterium]MBU4179252.1 hypothetical protein [Actinomycetota bacterium]MBU4217372.1 hypothetical protein [Actinomycetota bacterium]MBU4359934.1 hypothetical protein [Actinomycetota bacterium]
MENGNRPGIGVRVAKLICMGLALFDILLGGLTVLKPRWMMRILTPGEEPAGEALLRRSGTTWLFFALVQAWAAMDNENPTALRAVSVLRLQDVPTDLVWLRSGSGFGWFGKFSLILAPTFNFAVGCFLAQVARRIEKKEGAGEQYGGMAP